MQFGPVIGTQKFLASNQGVLVLLQQENFYPLPNTLASENALIRSWQTSTHSDICAIWNETACWLIMGGSVLTYHWGVHKGVVFEHDWNSFLRGDGSRNVELIFPSKCCIATFERKQNLYGGQFFLNLFLSKSSKRTETNTLS